MLFESKISFKDFLEKYVQGGLYSQSEAVDEVIYSMSYNKVPLELAVDLAHFLQKIKKVTDEDIETFEYLLNEIPDIYAKEFINKAVVPSAPALSGELPVWMLWNDWTASNVNNKSFKPFNDLVSYAVLKGPNHIGFIDQTAPGFTGTVYQLRETLENIFE